MTAFTAIGLIIAGYLFSPPAPLVVESYISITNRISSIVVVIICAILIIKYKKIEQKTIDLAIDVSKRKRAEDKFKAILESAPDAIVIVNSDGKIHLVNAHTENLFGYNRDEIIGKEMEMLMPSRYRHTHHSHRKDFSDNPKVRPMGDGVELFAQHKDGKEFSKKLLRI